MGTAEWVLVVRERALDASTGGVVAGLELIDFRRSSAFWTNVRRADELSCAGVDLRSWGGVETGLICGSSS